MRSSSRLCLVPTLFIAVACFFVPLLIQTEAAPENGFQVAFDAHPGLDHVCFYITLKNMQESDDAFPFKFLLNRTSIDIAKAEAKLWEEEDYGYEVTHCNTCGVEFQDCALNNETKEETCEPYNASVSDCDKCGSWKETKTSKRWAAKALTSTDRTIVTNDKTSGKEYELNTLRNQFGEIQLKKSETKHYKLCYYFNEIPVNPMTGMPGSYGYMYLDVKDKLHYDFENSSCWNTSCCSKKMPVYGWCPHCSSETAITLLVSNSTYNVGAYINGSLELFWGNFTVDSTWDVIGYVYYNNETDYALVDPTESYQLAVTIDEGNSTNYGNAFDDAYIVYLMNSTSGTEATDASGNGNDATLTDGANFVSSGKNGHGVNFTADNTGMTITSSASSNIYKGTMMIWYKPSETMSSSGGIHNNHDRLYRPENGFVADFFFWKDHGNLYADGYCDGTPNYLITTTATWTANTWYHIAYTWNDTSITVYVNGVPENSCIQHTNFDYMNFNAWKIGYRSSNYGTAVGIHDDFVAWNKTLSDDEILLYYNNTINTHNVTQFGPEKNTPLPQITIYSPVNTTYNTTTIDLNWSADLELDWAGYSLDGKENVSLFVTGQLRVGEGLVTTSRS